MAQDAGDAVRLRSFREAMGKLREVGSVRQWNVSGAGKSRGGEARLVRRSGLVQRRLSGAKPAALSRGERHGGK